MIDFNNDVLQLSHGIRNIEASCTNNMHTAENFFLLLLLKVCESGFFFRQSKKTFSMIWSA